VYYAYKKIERKKEIIEMNKNKRQKEENTNKNR
jgi:hypothetical protein